MTSEVSFRSGRIYSAFSVLLHKIAEFFISLHVFISINVLDFFLPVNYNLGKMFHVKQ